VLTIAATGITVFEALKAADELKGQGISVRVLDCYCINPIDKKALIKSLQETRKQILITVEDHFVHGGMGDFAAAAISEISIHVEKMAVSQISESGSKNQLLNKAGIDAPGIIARVKELIK
jgi:transketolase